MQIRHSTASGRLKLKARMRISTHVVGDGDTDLPSKSADHRLDDLRLGVTEWPPPPVIESRDRCFFPGRWCCGVSPSSVSLSPDSPSDEVSEVSLSRKPKRLGRAGGRAACVLRCSAALGLSAERSGATPADNGTLFARIPAFDTGGDEEVEGYEGGLGISCFEHVPSRPKQR